MSYPHNNLSYATYNGSKLCQEKRNHPADFAKCAESWSLAVVEKQNNIYFRSN